MTGKNSSTASAGWPIPIPCRMKRRSGANEPRWCRAASRPCPPSSSRSFTCASTWRIAGGHCCRPGLLGGHGEIPAVPRSGQAAGHERPQGSNRAAPKRKLEFYEALFKQPKAHGLAGAGRAGCPPRSGPPRAYPNLRRVPPLSGGDFNRQRKRWPRRRRHRTSRPPNPSTGEWSQGFERSNRARFGSAWPRTLGAARLDWRAALSLARRHRTGHRLAVCSLAAARRVAARARRSRGCPASGTKERSFADHLQLPTGRESLPRRIGRLANPARHTAPVPDPDLHRLDVWRRQRGGLSSSFPLAATRKR